jgi:hypothetical protein
MVLAYDAAGNVVATLDYVTAKDKHGDVVGLIDFTTQEVHGELLDVWRVEPAKGSGTWPEWLGGQAAEFRVERANGRISALVHKASGHRRERAKIEAAIEKRVKEAKANGEKAADLRDLVGGPDRPLLLDDEGWTKKRESVSRPNLPIIGREPTAG